MRTLAAPGRPAVAVVPPSLGADISTTATTSSRGHYGDAESPLATIAKALLISAGIGAVAYAAKACFVSARRSADGLYGYDAEYRFAALGEAVGRKATVSPGSRGAYDVRLTSGRAQPLATQLKASRRGTPPWPSREERKRLIEHRQKTGDQIAMARLTPRSLEIRDPETGAEIDLYGRPA